MMTKKVYGEFRDSVIWNSDQKTAISVRDGVLEYLGSEIGYEPADKVFRVYRSPATIANAAAAMVGIPLTNEHVSLDLPPTDPKGEVLSAKMIDLNRPEYDARIGVLNTVRVDNELTGHLDAGKRELSLGYNASLIEAGDGCNFDLEQIEIIPHHLAVVDAGRCGSVCSFIDHKRFNDGESETMAKKTKMHKAFQDAEGAPSMTEIVAIVQALPEALKQLPVDELNKVMPTLQEIVKASGGATPGAETTDGDEEHQDGEQEQVMDENGDEPKKSVTDGEGDEPKKPVTDEDKDDKQPITDSRKFKDAVAAATGSAVKRHVAVMDKARAFLPENYKFADKSTVQIMRDAVAVEHGKTQFNDSELEIAFKMLKKNQSRYGSFGDSASAGGKFAAMQDKEI